MLNWGGMMLGKKFLVVACFFLSQFGFSEFIDPPSFYGGDEAIYTELKANWPDFTYTAPTVDGKLAVPRIFDANLQLFPCGPLKALLIAFKGSKELCIYHFINNDGTHIKQTNQSFKSYRTSKGRYKAHIEKGVKSLLPPFGINRLDIIVGVNGVLFSQPHSPNNIYGELGPIYDLAIAIEKGQAKGHISLMLISSKDNPKKPPHSITIKLEKLPRFSKTYPAKCRRSAILETELLDILAKDSERPKLSNNISWGMVGLAMLASGQKKYLPAIENYAMHICNGMLKGGGPTSVVTAHQHSSWKSGFHLMFIAEYFWATGDMTVFPVLQRLAYDADEWHHNVFGGAGHGAHGTGTYWSLSFGPPNGLNALGAAIAEKTGAKVNSKLYVDYWEMLTNTKLNHINQGNEDYKFTVKDDQDYFASYGHETINTPIARSTGYLQCINTSLASMALLHSRYPDKNVKKLALKFNDNMIYNYTISSYIHASPMIGSFFSQMSLNMFNNSRVLEDKVKASFNTPYAKKYFNTAGKEKFTAHDAWRRIMDYRKYLLILSRVSKDDYLYFIPKKQNSGGWGGDSYANLRGSALYNLLNLTVSNRRNLLMYGNKRRNWLVSRNAKEARLKSKVTVKKIKEYHNIYSMYLLKQIDFLMKGGKDKAKVAAGDKKLQSYYTLMAYEVAKKVIAKYPGYPAYKKAKQIAFNITKKFGGKKALALHQKNLKGLEIIDYVTALQERVNTKEWISMRKRVLKFVQNNYKGCPAAKIAVEESYRTDRLSKLDAPEGTWITVEPDSEFIIKARIPRIDIKDVESN